MSDERIADLRRRIADGLRVPPHSLVLASHGILLEDDMLAELVAVGDERVISVAVRSEDADLRERIREVVAFETGALKDSTHELSVCESQAELVVGIREGSARPAIRRANANEEIARLVEVVAVEAVSSEELKAIQTLKADYKIAEFTTLAIILMYLDCGRDFAFLRRSLLVADAADVEGAE
jgi:hypothetical protein